VREAVTDPRGLVTDLFATDEAAARHADIFEAAGGIPIHLVSGEVLGALGQTVTPQGLVAVARFCDVTLEDVLVNPPRLVTVLYAVRDPGNAGTVIRTADAAGADAVVLTDPSVDPYNGKCVRASAGSLFHLPFVTGVPVAAAVARLRSAGLAVLAADGQADDDLDEVADTGGLDGPTAWLFGNEAWGLPEAVRALADRVVRVPIHGRAESLNLATATAVCLYASARAQRENRPPDG
jgi:TrmH family RNA methyltransferase